MSSTDPISRKGRAAWLLAGVAAVVAFCVLMSLGVWQMQRLRWKEGLLAQIATRLHQSPAPLPVPERWSSMSPDDYEYMAVRVTGTFEHGKEALIFRPAGGEMKQPGFNVITPLRISGTEAHILVNRGFVPENLREPARRSAGQVTGEVTVTGVLRAPESRTAFTPADDAARGLWYSRDPHAMAKAAGLARAAPFSIDADASPNPGGWPLGGATVVRIPNDHLAYAMTWFALAGTLVVMSGLVWWRRRKA